LKEVETGKIIQISNLFDFCKKNKLNYQAIKNLFYELPDDSNRLTSQGYCLTETPLRMIGLMKKSQGWKALWENEIHLVNARTQKSFTINKDNIFEFSDQEGVSIKKISALLHGKIKHHKGWHKQGVEVKIQKRWNKPVRLISPEGEPIVVENLEQWVTRTLFSHLDKKYSHGKTSAFRKLILGKTQKAYGYTLDKNEKTSESIHS
jgi:hypothetical protein